MTADELAAIHARAMTMPPPWDARTFQGFLDAPGVFLVVRGAGFALGRVIADEAELLTLAVDPAQRRAGLGLACLQGFETGAEQAGAARAFLEVAETNSPARALYTAAGWREDGRRPRYYSRPGAAPVDAILMSKSLVGGGLA